MSKTEKYPENPLEIITSKFTPSCLIYNSQKGFIIAKGFNEKGEKCIAAREHFSGKAGWPQTHGNPAWFIFPSDQASPMVSPSESEEIKALLDRGLTPSVYFMFGSIEEMEVGDFVEYQKKWYFVCDLPSKHSDKHLCTIYSEETQTARTVPVSEITDRINIDNKVYSELPSFASFHEDRILLWLLPDSTPDGTPAISYISPIRYGSSTRNFMVRELVHFKGLNVEGAVGVSLEMTHSTYFLTPENSIDGALLLGELPANKTLAQAQTLLESILPTIPKRSDWFSRYALEDFSTPKRIKKDAEGNMLKWLSKLGCKMARQREWVYFDYRKPIGVWDYSRAHYIRGAGYEEHEALADKVIGYVREYGPYMPDRPTKRTQLFCHILNYNLPDASLYLRMEDLNDIAGWYEITYLIDTEEK